MAREKKTKIKEAEGFTLGGTEGLGLSLGALLGKEKNENSSCPKTSEEKPQKENKGEKPKSDNGSTKQTAPAISKVTLSRQTAGRGGKTVTVVTLPKECAYDRETLAKELRKALGCGSHTEEEKIILQGDNRDRAEEWFVKKGVKKITKA